MFRIGALALAATALMKIAMWFGATEPLAFIVGVFAVIVLALVELLGRKDWSKGSAAALAALFGPAIFFPLNDLYPNDFTEFLLWVGIAGMLLGFFYLFWSIFIRPVRTQG